MTMMLERSDIYGLVAEIDGDLVGSNFLWEGDAIAGVGPITVSPNVQNSSIGRHLMRGVLDRAAERSCASVRLLQAGYHGRSLALYAKLGFDVKSHIVNLQGTITAILDEARFVRPATADDIESCDALCTRIHGYSRSHELRFAIEHGLAMLVDRSGCVTGYTTGVGFFGHAVGETDSDIKALITAAPGRGCCCRHIKANFCGGAWRTVCASCSRSPSWRLAITRIRAGRGYHQSCTSS